MIITKNGFHFESESESEPESEPIPKFVDNNWSQHEQMKFFLIYLYMFKKQVHGDHYQ